MGLSSLKTTLWLYLSLLLWLVKIPSQQNTPNSIEDQLENLQHVILARLDRMDNRIISLGMNINDIMEQLSEMSQEKNKSKMARDNHILISENISTKMDKLDNQFNAGMDNLSSFRNETFAELDEVKKLFNQKIDNTTELVDELKSQGHIIINQFNQTIEILKDPIDLINLQGNRIINELQVEIQGRNVSIAAINDLHLSHKQTKDWLVNMDNNLNQTLTSINQQVDKTDEQIIVLKSSLNSTLLRIKNIVDEKLLLVFNPIQMTLFVGQPLHLECGVIGRFQSCHWDHNGTLYQIDSEESASRSSISQCSLNITSVSQEDEGNWTCNILTFGEVVSASKTIMIDTPEIIFNSTDISLHVGEQIDLDCGVEGSFLSCHWEHNNQIYQFTDIANGSHANMLMGSNTTNNECGIKIAALTIEDNGIWTCKILTYDLPLAASKTIGCPGGFFKSKGSEQCFKMFKDNTGSWSDSKSKCLDEELLMAHPIDQVAVALRKDLLDAYGNGRSVWLDAHSDGNKFIWRREWKELRKSNKLWSPGNPSSTATTRCLRMGVYDSYWHSYPDQPYLDTTCSSSSLYTLCQAMNV